MPSVDFVQLNLDLIDLIGAVWPEVVPNGIWELDQIIRQAFVRRTFPYAVMHTPRMPAADWGLVNVAYEPRVDVYYVALEEGTQDVPTGLADLKNKLQELADAALQYAFSNGVTMLTEPEIDWSDSNPVNVFFYDKDQPFRSGLVSLPLVVWGPAGALP